MQSKSTTTVNNEESADELMEESAFEQICDTIFVLIPEVPRLKQLFLSWSQLGTEDRALLDAKVADWCCPSRRQLYKPLQEALIRWETVQDTQGAPGCEPGMVSFSCDPQLEEELVSVICSLELLFSKNRKPREIDMDYEVPRCTGIMRDMSLNLNCESNLQSILTSKERMPRSVHSCGYISDLKRSDDEFSGYLTN
ncbi:uncharacterized protein LOC116424923 [Nomia melanderi]|uniref:uncharacterized protein LOC116424923 n=1 Tax=Nomia melanderi TaxID=2448451 RepID=UPI001304628F|nr:uncharacterized protein LOC116424923 [Nomia melanderi]